jgi:hypothetical protein
MASSMHMKAIYTRARLTGLEDVAVTTHDFHAPNFDDFTDDQCRLIGDQYEGFWIRINPFIANSYVLLETRFYKGYNGDGSPGEVDLVHPSGENGAAVAGACPPQIACSVTEILGAESRRHWGRFYLPGPAVSSLATDGSWSPDFVTAVANEAKVMYDAWTTSDVFPIVWVGRAPGGASGFAQVTEIRVDNIPDVIRRRRFEDVSQRETRPIV